MNKIEKADVTIDRCSNCLGIWLDKGELDKIIIKRKKRYPEENKQERDWGKPNIGAIPPSEDDDEEIIYY